jgi:hypothetical protein
MDTAIRDCLGGRTQVRPALVRDTSTLAEAGRKWVPAAIVAPELPDHSVSVTPGIQAAEYESRRSRLASRLPKGSIAILAAAPLKYRSGAVFYDYRQESNFLYLTGATPSERPRNAFSHPGTGFNEPQALAVIRTRHCNRTALAQADGGDREASRPRRLRFPPLRTPSRHQTGTMGGGQIWPRGRYRRL